MINKYDMLDSILQEELLDGKKMDPKSILFDLVGACDDRSAERALKAVARNWGITLSSERDRNEA